MTLSKCEMIKAYTYTNLVTKSQEERLLVRSQHFWVDDIKIELREIHCKVVNYRCAQ